MRPGVQAHEFIAPGDDRGTRQDRSPDILQARPLARSHLLRNASAARLASARRRPKGVRAYCQ